MPAMNNIKIALLYSGASKEREVSLKSGKREEKTLKDKLREKVQKLALKVFKQTRAKDLFRIDFMINKKGRPYTLKINTIPDMRSKSLLLKAAKVEGYSFKDFLKTIINNARQRNLEKNKNN